jgi:hypothetical protein
MKGAVSMENCQQSHSYCIWWRRVGGPDRFQHWVLAESIDDAVSRSRLDVTKALGTNTSLWNIEEPEDKITQAIPIDVVCGGSVRSSQRVGIMAFIVLLLGLGLLSIGNRGRLHRPSLWKAMQLPQSALPKFAQKTM